MPKKNATQFWLRTELIQQLEGKKSREGRVEGTATYIETILNQYVEEKLTFSETPMTGNAIADAKLRLLEIMKLLSRLGEELKGTKIKSLRGGKGPVDLRGHTGEASQPGQPGKANLHKG